MSSGPLGGRERLYVAALASLPGIGPARLRRVLAGLGGPAAAWQAPAEALARAAGLPEGWARAPAWRPQGRQRHLERLAAGLRRCGARVLTLWDTDFPALLRRVPDPPPVLFVRGRLPPEDGRAVAIVGSRHGDPAGWLTAQRLAMELAEAGFTIVSGLAAGVDGAAHRGALQAHGRTVGVLGCGIDRVYPGEHRELYDRVAGQGALIGEYPPGEPPARWRFARRNRIIAGLSAAVVVVEAREGSGAVATAMWARRLCRQVLAVPGDVLRDSCQGSNRLLAEGARICLRAADVVEAVGEQLSRWGAPEGSTGLALTPRGPAAGSGPPLQGHPQGDARLSAGALRLLEVMGSRPRELEELSVATGEGPGSLLGALTELELAGRARRLPDGRWLRRRAASTRTVFPGPGPGL